MGNLCGGPATAPDGKAKIHALTLSCNAMSPVLFAQDTGIGAFEFCDLMSGAHLKPEFLAKNAFHTIPTYEGADGFTLGESNAILRYMAAKYAPAYYPDDPKMRARIDWAMDAMGTSVYQKWLQRTYPILGFGSHPADQAKVNEELSEILSCFKKTFIGQGKYICGDKLTIADYKVMPYLHCAMQPMIKQKSGIQIDPRLEQYVKDCMAAMPSSSMLKAADGFGVEEFLATKTDLPNYAGSVVTCGSGPTAGAMKTGAAKAGEKAAKIHGMPVSANCTGSLMLATETGVGAMELCNLMEGAHKKPAFLEKNPFHQIPTYEGSDGFCIGEGNAIMRFIASNYAPQYYPGDAENRAKIDMAMDLFSTGVYQKVAVAVVYPVMGFGAPPADQAKVNSTATEALGMVEKTFFQTGKFLVGSQPTIADFKALPFLYAANQPAVKKKTGFTLPPRFVTYVNDCVEAFSKSNSLLTSAGGFSIKEYLATKE